VSDLVSVKLPPGFFRNGTEYEAAGRWYDGSLVRWENGRIKPIGGWRRVLAEHASLTGKAREMIAWRGNTGFRYVAIGTNEKLYISSGGDYTDATPNDLVPGRENAIEGPGYGAGPYGEASYGTQRSEGTVALDAASWSMDTWGQDWVGVLSSDGRLLEWSPLSGGDPAPIANAPTDNVGVLVTDQQYLMALGAGGDRRRVRWCDQSNNTVWSVSDLTTAGSRLLKTAGNILTGRRVGSVILIWTTNDVHSMQYLGPPLVYNNDCIAEDCGVISTKGMVVWNGKAAWMSLGGFFLYDGIVSPLPCDVQDHVFNDLNVSQRSKIYAGHNSRFGEITWYYPSANSIECDSYVTLNYKNKGGFIWYFGKLARTCWLDRGVFQLPMAVDPDGVIWEHEIGFLNDGASRNADVFALSGPAEIGSGDRVIYSNLMLPDASNPSAFQVRMKLRNAPLGPQTSAGPYQMAPNAEGYTPCRIAGRQVSMRIEQLKDEDWSLGNTRFKIAAGGKR
jgi:hypothetical protein